MTTQKSATDLHWNTRAKSVETDVEVNIMDIFQRELEYDFITSRLKPDMTMLEVGCGNGFSSNRLRPLVERLVSFDFAEDMIERAKATYGETNNTFLHDTVLAPTKVAGQYDTVLCVRVLINLRNLDEQHRALRNLTDFVKPGGQLLLLEGFTEGFDGLSDARSRLGLPPVQPAAINFYSSVDECLRDLRNQYVVEEDFHLGAYDYLTRVVYPFLVGAENVKHNTEFSEKSATLARQMDPSYFPGMSRVRGFAMRKNAK